jgi:hypothetical protein
MLLFHFSIIDWSLQSARTEIFAFVFNFASQRFLCAYDTRQGRCDARQIEKFK